jgi:endonuclease/exonuclease/phosphatase family metal-dependent hydrolase
VSLIRGFVIIDAIIDGQQIRIANTHLESGSGDALSGLRALQAGQLVSEVGSASPAILLGDFNDPVGTPMYTLLLGAGFADVWATLRPGAGGPTCCHDPDLSNKVSALDERIDYVFSWGIAGPQGKVQGQVTIIGDQPGDRVQGPDYRIWPSDHAGLVARFVQPPATGLALR